MSIAGHSLKGLFVNAAFTIVCIVAIKRVSAVNKHLGL